MIPSTVQAAPEATSVHHDPLTTLTQTDEQFAAWYERWQAKRDETQAKVDAAYARIMASVDDRTGRLIGMDYCDALRDSASLDWQLFVETTFRHFPGLAPALRLAFEHAIDSYSDQLGTCCSEGMEPW